MYADLKVVGDNFVISGGASGYRRREIDTAARVQILDETDFISHSTNTFGEGMNPIILPPAMGK